MDASGGASHKLCSSTPQSTDPLCLARPQNLPNLQLKEATKLSKMKTRTRVIWNECQRFRSKSRSTGLPLHLDLGGPSAAQGQMAATLKSRLDSRSRFGT